MKKVFSNRYVQAIGVILMSVVLELVGACIGAIINIPFDHSGNDVLVFAGNYFIFIGIWIVMLAFCWFRKRNRVLLPKLGKGGRGNNWKTILALGLPCGIGLNLIVAFVAMLHGDIKLAYAGFDPTMLLLFLVCVAIQSGAEELLDRFYIYEKIREIFPEHPLVPMIVNAVVFSAGHIFNSGITALAIVNIVLVGILYSLIIFYFDCFWAAVLAHTSWNFCQNILLGLPNSGIVSVYSVFRLDASTAMNSFAYNVNFGIEGTILASVVLAATCVVIVIIGRKKMAREQQAASS